MNDLSELRPGSYVTGRRWSRGNPDRGEVVLGRFMAFDAEGDVAAVVDGEVTYLSRASCVPGVHLYEESHVRPHGPRTAGAWTGATVTQIAEALSTPDAPLAWWECLMEEDGGPADPFSEDPFDYRTGTYASERTGSR